MRSQHSTPKRRDPREAWGLAGVWTKGEGSSLGAAVLDFDRTAALQRVTGQAAELDRVERRGLARVRPAVRRRAVVDLVPRLAVDADVREVGEQRLLGQRDGALDLHRDRL